MSIYKGEQKDTKLYRGEQLNKAMYRGDVKVFGEVVYTNINDSSLWQQGGIHSSTGQTNTSDFYSRTINYINVEGGVLHVSLNVAQEAGVYQYNGNTFVYGSVYFNPEGVRVITLDPTTTRIKIAVRNAGGSGYFRPIRIPSTQIKIAFE